MTHRPRRTIERSDPGISADGLVFETVKSDALGHRADITFYVPPCFSAVEHVPIILLMHGAYGSHWAWALKGDAHNTTARLIAEGALPPVVLAMPSDGLWGDGSGYVRHEHQDFERWIIDEVPAAAVALGVGCTSASPLYLAGLSMGGFGAMRLAGRYPRRVAAAAAHSAVTDAWQIDAMIDESIAGWSAAPEDRSIFGALRTAPAPLPPLRFDCGRDDPLLDVNRVLHAQLDTAGIKHVYVEAEGGHDWSYWRRQVEHSLRFFGAHMGRASDASDREKRWM